MKTYRDNDTGAMLIVGAVDEIRPVYKSIRRNSFKFESNISMSHISHAKFRHGEIYGLEIVPPENACNISTVWVRTASNVLRALDLV